MSVGTQLISAATRARLDELFGMVQKELDDHGLSDHLGAGIVLTGGCAALPGLVELAQQVFAAPVRLGVPGEGLTGLADSVGRPRLSTGAGLAIWGSERYSETGEGASTVMSGFVSKVIAWAKEFF